LNIKKKKKTKEYKKKKRWKVKYIV